ncbi:MAG: ATP-binding cassette domain-containing protein [Kiritimatiellae bacterium]|nr:ATP-binding cassette domain-containing protein [Kiritimatiellia bacterium]
MKSTRLLFASTAVGLLVAVVETGLFPAANTALVAALEKPSETTVVRVVGLVALFFAAKVFAHAGTLLSQILRAHLAMLCVEARKRELFRRILFASPSFHARIEPERIVERMEAGVEESVPFFATAPVTLSVALVSFLWSLWQMAFDSPGAFVRWGLLREARKGNQELAALAVVSSVLVVAVISLFEKRKDRHFKNARTADEDVRGIESEALRGVQDIRSAGAFPFAFCRIFAAFAKSRRASFRFQSLMTLFAGAGGFAFHLAETAVLAGAARLIFRHGSGFAYSDYVGFASLCASFNGAALALYGLWQDARKAMMARSRLREFDSLPPVFAPESGAAPSAPPSLAFRDLSFSAPDGTAILHGVNLSILPGSHVALVGPSGCGKSTLLKLAMRHLDPTGGTVEVAGAALADWDFAAYARRVAYVSQHPFIFDGSIRENILMGRELSLDDAGILAIADDVGLLDDLSRKAENPAEALNLPAGPEGRALSGGQAAKIALARALAGNPDILLLDEVTAPLDELSQQRVAHLLAGKCRGKTILSISHRLPAVRGMDRIVVMDGGRIVQDGTWDELANRPGLFADLVARETGGASAPREPLPGGASRPGEPPAVIRALSLSPVFADLDSAQLSRLTANAATETIAAGAFLFRKGDAGDSLCLVASGSVEINGTQYGPGYAFGEIALFGGLRRTADVRAVEDASFIVLRRDDVLAVCRETPEISIRLLGSLARIAAKA